MESLTISRVIFLLFIVVLSVYFVYLNKNFQVEHFEEKVTKTITDTLSSEKAAKIITATYKSEFQRDPSQEEIMFFQAVNIEKSPSEKELAAIVKNSANLLDKRNSAYEMKMKSDKVYGESIVTKPAFGTEDEVSEIYNMILNRLPSETELMYFSKLLVEDKNFNFEKLKQLLYGSEEYGRLEKTQSNLVYSNVMGGVTDRQIRLMVTTNYKAVVGKETIDPDEMKFLKKKLIEFNLDEKIFKQFLQNYVKNQPFNQQVIAAEKAKQFVKETQDEKKEKEKYENMKKELYTQVMNDVKAQSQIAQQERPAYTDQKGKSLAQVEQPNKQVIEVLLKTASDRNDNYLDSSDVLDTIKKQAKCVFDKDAYDKKYTDLDNKEKSMAALIEQRNKEHIKDTCVRNRTYLGIDEDMVLDPSLRWSLPQKRPPVCVGGKNDYEPRIDQTALIGTLLEDAKKTKVGNVVDFHPPK